MSPVASGNISCDVEIRKSSKTNIKIIDLELLLRKACLTSFNIKTKRIFSLRASLSQRTFPPLKIIFIKPTPKPGKSKMQSLEIRFIRSTVIRNRLKSMKKGSFSTKANNLGYVAEFYLLAFFLPSRMIFFVKPDGGFF